MTRKELAEIRSEIAAAVADGGSPEDVARTYGYTVDYVKKIARGGGSDGQPSTKSKQRRAMILALHAEGKSTTEIARAAKCGYYTVSSCLASEGLRSHPPLKRTRKVFMRILAALVTSASPPVEIAKSFGVSRQYVDQVGEMATSVGIPLHASRRPII